MCRGTLIDREPFLRASARPGPTGPAARGAGAIGSPRWNTRAGAASCVSIMLSLLVFAIGLVMAPTASADTTRIPLAPVPHASVGRVASTGAFIAVSRERGKLRVYVCDG